MRKRRNGSTRSAPDTRRCAIYTRKSTTIGFDQEFNTLDAQREACELYIEGQAHDGWQFIPEQYDDGGFTGANLARPAFQRLLADIEAGKIDIVVVYKVDRLSRSLLDFAQVMGRFNRAGAAFVSVTQNFSTADAMGRLTLNMLMSFAEFEREMIAERTRDKIAASRRKGKWTGGPVPLGYDVVDKHLVINELEAVVVREIFDTYEQHRSALTVAHLLNERGRATKRHRAKNGNVREARKWTKDAVLRILRNPVLAGHMASGDELFEAEHTAIIDRDRWRQAMELLDRNAGKKKQRGRNPAYLLRGILRCGRCGQAMTPASTRKKGGAEYRYYRCVTRDKEGTKACLSGPLSADAIEAFIVDRLRGATTDGSLARDVQKKLQGNIEAQRKTIEAERRALPGAIAKLSTEGRNLVETLGQAKGTAHRLLEERIEDIGDQLAKYERKLTEVQRALVALDQTEIETQWVVESLTHFDAVWEAMSLENRGCLVRAIVEKVKVDEPSGQVTAVLLDLEMGDDVPLPETPATNDTEKAEVRP
jgi:DNA invertase Pin-like site-specific DNA recombinase